MGVEVPFLLRDCIVWMGFGKIVGLLILFNRNGCFSKLTKTLYRYCRMAA